MSHKKYKVLKWEDMNKMYIPIISKFALIPRSLRLPFSFKNELNRLQVIAKFDFSDAPLPFPELYLLVVDMVYDL